MSDAIQQEQIDQGVMETLRERDHSALAQQVNHLGCDNNDIIELLAHYMALSEQENDELFGSIIVLAFGLPSLIDDEIVYLGPLSVLGGLIPNTCTSIGCPLIRTTIIGPLISRNSTMNWSLSIATLICFTICFFQSPSIGTAWIWSDASSPKILWNSPFHSS